MYDAIVVGARVAGSPTAMLLARKGYRVLAVDRATFPSDTLSTHVIHAPGVAALQRWGLLDEVVATGCPPITQLQLRLRRVHHHRHQPAGRRHHDGYARGVRCWTRSWSTPPARPVSRSARVTTSTRCSSRTAGSSASAAATAVDRARIVIGADGRNSQVAKAVGVEEYNTKPRLQYSYYTYFSGLPTDRLETYIRPDRGFGVARDATTG